MTVAKLDFTYVQSLTFVRENLIDSVVGWEFFEKRKKALKRGYLNYDSFPDLTIFLLVVKECAQKSRNYF